MSSRPLPSSFILFTVYAMAAKVSFFIVFFYFLSCFASRGLSGTVNNAELKYVAKASIPKASDV